VDKKLHKWKKYNSIQNGESVRMEWQFEQLSFVLYLFTDQDREGVGLQFSSPRYSAHWTWHGLTNETINRVLDRIGNTAQTAMHPPIFPDC